MVCIHIKCRGLARSRILPAGKQTWSRLASVLRYAASETAVHAGEGWAPTKAALITYRELVRALDRQPADGPLAQWQAAVAELAPEFVWTGYFGGTSRASSAFEGVDLLVTLGDPWPNISGRRVDLAAMGVSPDEVDDRMRAEVATKLGQIMGRARAKTALLIHIGSVLPAGWDAATVVTVESRPPGRPPAQDAAAWRSWLERAAETLGAVSEPLVRAVVSAAKQSAAPRWVSGVLAHAGAPPQSLPPGRRLRRLIDEATQGPRWRAVGSTRDRFRVREDLGDDEGRLLLAFYRDVAEGKEPVVPDVSPRARWWWPDEDAAALDEHSAAEPSVPLPTAIACEAAAANDLPEHDVDSGT